MTQNEYEWFLTKHGISQTAIKTFFDKVLFDVEDSLKYIDHVREFCSDIGISAASTSPLNIQFMRSLLIKLITSRVTGGYRGAETIFNRFLPSPSDDAIKESRRYRDDQEREFRYRSEKRRGFYRNGEPTHDCGEDLRIWLELYEYKTKG